MIRELAVTSILLLAGCEESQRQQEAAWGHRCLSAGFNGDQCGLLWDVLRARKTAESTDALAFGMSTGTATGIAIGMSVSGKR